MTGQNRNLVWRLRTGERRILLLLGDLLAAVLAVFIALQLWARVDYLGPDPSAQFVRARAPWFVLLPFVWVLLMVNLYDIHRAASWRESIKGILVAVAVGAVLYLALYFSAEGSLPRRGVLYFLAFAAGLTLLWRALYVWIFNAPAFMRRVLIVGAGQSGQAILGVIAQQKPQPYFVVGMIDDDAQKEGLIIGGARVIGTNEHVLDLVKSEAITDIVVAITGSMNGTMFQALLDAQEQGVEITRMPAAYEELLGRVPIRHLESDWLLRSFIDDVRISGFYQVVKRLMDLAGALFGLLMLCLTLPWVTLAILIESGRPVFYRQARLGHGGKHFQVVKIRTMHKDAEADGRAHWARAGDPRTTSVGKVLRRMHLDELPQFWNVLKGDMSLVGPRPERPELVSELEKEIPFYRARLLVKPGLTGWAQINYGKGASVEGSAEKLEYDLYYIKHRTLLMDLWIILRTLGSVIGFRGI
jgi:exopolysaccharide biosynthesis polyprenyl glycosylphosphotransferase